MDAIEKIVEVVVYSRTYQDQEKYGKLIESLIEKYGDYSKILLVRLESKQILLIYHIK